MNENVGLLEKGIAVLELIAQAEDPMGPTKIAQMANLNKATVYRILQTLTKYGYASKNDAGKYICGAKLVELASCFINNLELQTEAKPFLEALTAQLGLSVHLGLLEDGETVYIEKMESRRSGMGYTQVGYKSPAHCSSIGKCLLASKSFVALDEILHYWKFKKYTENTITDPNELKEHLRMVRTQGWAMDREEYMIGHCCLGAPIFDYRGDAIACVSVSGTAEDFTDDKLPVIVDQVKIVAMQISKQIGYNTI